MLKKHQTVTMKGKGCGKKQNVWLRVQLERKRLGMTVMALVKHLTISQRMGAVLMCVFLAHI